MAISPVGALAVGDTHVSVPGSGEIENRTSLDYRTNN